MISRKNRMNQRPQQGRQQEPCVVCGLDDARALTTARLGDGTDASVCGTHYLVHARMTTPATSVTELRSTLREKRRRTERRGQMAEVDELGAQLAEAFTTERRVGSDRRN